MLATVRTAAKMHKRLKRLSQLSYATRFEDQNILDRVNLLSASGQEQLQTADRPTACLVKRD